MPSGKRKENFNDTWKEADLEKSIKGTKDESRRRHTDKERDERKRDRHKTDDEKRHRTKAEGDDKRERRHRDKENGEVKQKDKGRDDRHARSKPEDRDSRSQRGKTDDKDRGERRHRSQHEDKEGRHRSDRKDDRDDKRHRSDRKDDREDKRRGDGRRKEGGERQRRHDDDREHRKNRNDDEVRKHRQSRDDEKHKKHREEDDRDRRHRKSRDDKEGDRHRKDKDERRTREEKHHRSNDEDDKERRRRHEEKKRKEEEKKRPTQEDDKERKKRHEEKKRREEERKRQEEQARSKEQLSEDDEGNDYDYDDDFEDYDDDFENDESDESESEEDEKEVKPLSASNKELDEIRKAMHEENERVLSGNRRTTTEKPEQMDSDRGSTKKRTFINFVSAKQRQVSSKLASKTCNRGRELLHIIDLDRTSYDMFEMPPITEYKLYMRTYGRSDAKQAYVQTNDDNIDRDLQTEAIESTEKWTQHPPVDVKGYGGPEEETAKADEEMKSVDTVKLNKFLQASGQVMLVLLEEERATRSQSNVAKKQSNICVSEAFVDLTVPELLQGRHVVHSQFSPSQSHLLLTAHSLPSQHSSNKFSSSGVVCFWNANDPSRPQKILMCESQPRCCCFSPSKATLAFAGMNDGSVVLWDLRESPSLHRTYNGNDGQWLLRFPTYDTAGVLDYDNHHSPVVAIQPVTVLADSGDTSAAVTGFADTGDSLSFQLATLEENSVVHLWVVAEISNPDPSGSESDLGLLPGGRVKLIKSSSIPLESPLRNARIQTTLQSLDMQLLPTNNSHFYVTTDTGCIIHGVRYGGKAPPRVYRPEFDILIKVTSIDFSPFTEPVFLTGCNDGSLRLYSIKSERPLLTWTDSTNGVAIRCIRWCRSRPAVFFLLDEASQLYIWDLLLEDSGPIKQETIAKSRVTNLALSNDHTATGVGIQGRSPQMVVGLENGTIEIHTISKEFSALMLEEIDQFATYIQRLF